MRQVMTTVADLRTWVGGRLGADGDDTIRDAVAESIRSGQCGEHPPWGDDWAGFLADVDLWHVATALHL